MQKIHISVMLETASLETLMLSILCAVCKLQTTIHGETIFNYASNHFSINCKSVPQIIPNINAGKGEGPGRTSRRRTREVNCAATPCSQKLSSEVKLQV